MKIETRWIAGLAEGLAALLGAKMPKARAFQIARFAADVRHAALTAEELRLAALRRHGKPNASSGYDFETGEAAAGFAAEMEELAKCEVALPDLEIKLSEIPEDLDRIGMALLNLQPILVEG